jgi:hypothetical protein
MGVLQTEVDDKDEGDKLKEDKLDEGDRRLLLDVRVSLNSFLLAFFRSASDVSFDDALLPRGRSFD